MWSHYYVDRERVSRLDVNFHAANCRSRSAGAPDHSLVALSSQSARFDQMRPWRRSAFCAWPAISSPEFSTADAACDDGRGNLADQLPWRAIAVGVDCYGGVAVHSAHQLAHLQERCLGFRRIEGSPRRPIHCASAAALMELSRPVTLGERVAHKCVSGRLQT